MKRKNNACRDLHNFICPNGMILFVDTIELAYEYNFYLPDGSYIGSAFTDNIFIDGTVILEYFNSQHESRGYGRCMFYILSHLWKELGMKRINLVPAENAVRFWEKMGFDVDEDCWIENEFCSFYLDDLQDLD